MKTPVRPVVAFAAFLGCVLTGWTECPAPAGGWKSRAIALSAPKPNEIARFNAFVTNTLAPAGVDTIVLLTHYRYQFASHPECAASNALSRTDVKAIRAACDAGKVRLIPKMNLFGHQGGRYGAREGLLAAHPELDESLGRTEIRHNYCRSICPKHPDALRYVTDLASEMAEAFGADTMHIGCDEVFEIGLCPRCKDTPTATLFADWVNGIARHLRAKGVRTMIWADRLLDAKTNYSVWEASDNGTDGALGRLDKDIICCDWHYKERPAYPSVETLADAGHDIFLCPWRYVGSTRKFLDYAVKHDKGRFLGVMLTTWYPVADVMDAIEGTLSTGISRDRDAQQAATLCSLSRNFTYMFPAAKVGWTWYDGSELPIEGKGWTRREQTETYYDRLPKAHEKEIPPRVWQLQKHTAGMSFRFVTDSDRLNIRWKPRFETLSRWHMPSTGVSGVDVYQWNEARGKWLFVDPPCAVKPKAEGASYVWNVTPNAPTLVHLPLYNGLDYIRLGVNPGCTVRAAPPRKSGIVKPVVFYGTSTTQGGCVSRPGLCWTSIATRLADVPQVNLGFSGSGKMEDVMNDCLAEIDASCYVLDTCGNMDVALLKERFEAFLRKLHARKPGVPIVVPAHPWDEMRPAAGQTAGQDFLRDLCARLKAEDPVLWKDLHFLGFEPEFAEDNDSTVEGLHMNDIGSLRMGTVCGRLLQKILTP